MEDRIEREEYNLSKSTLIWVSVAIKQAAMSKEVLDDGQFGLATRCMVKDDQDECIEVATDEFLYCFINWTTLEVDVMTVDSEGGSCGFRVTINQCLQRKLKSHPSSEISIVVAGGLR